MGKKDLARDGLVIPRGLTIKETNQFRAFADSMHTAEEIKRFLERQKKNRAKKKKGDTILADLRAFAETGSGKTFNRNKKKGTATEEAVGRRVSK